MALYKCCIIHVVAPINKFRKKEICPSEIFFLFINGQKMNFLKEKVRDLMSVILEKRPKKRFFDLNGTGRLRFPK